MPKKAQICQLGKFRGSLAARYRVAGELLSLPPEARKVLRGVDAAPPLVTEAFDRAARLYQVATICGRYFPSVGLAYRVAAVEAIAQVAKAADSFSTFMRRYVHSQKDLNSILAYLYGSVRSGHFHGGEFPMGEFSARRFFDSFLDQDDVQRMHIHHVCYEITREAIVNWLTEVIPGIPEDPEEKEGPH